MSLFKRSAELIDSSLWRIYAKDQKILQRLQQEFSRIREAVMTWEHYEAILETLEI